ncbi:AmmeMemoRadiSam system protein B [Candidatus Dojkabacteria bacterium]|nr:AmmeMemoRadiSam system protein B [Candidatus Dojkabacteria bacterium]
MIEEKVRKPTYAGSFYPEDSGTLRFAIGQYLDDAEVDCGKCNLRALIAPHAGYIYSGYTAGNAYKVLAHCSEKTKELMRIFILGPCHKTPVKGMGVSTVDVWNSPLGRVKVSEVARQMVKNEDLCNEANSAHEMEHSIEVQLPFIQSVLSGKQFEIVPVLFSEGDCVEYADIFEKYIGDNDLLIVSTDLSHYHPYDEAKDIDQKTIDSILSLSYEYVQSSEDSCGNLPLSVLVEIAKRHKWQPKLADYRTSGDTAGDKDSVVGYASIYFCGM